MLSKLCRRAKLIWKSELFLEPDVLLQRSNLRATFIAALLWPPRLEPEELLR